MGADLLALRGVEGGSFKDGKAKSMLDESSTTYDTYEIR